MDWSGDASMALEISMTPFMSIPGALAFSIYVDWFNAHGKSTWLASIGPIMLICLNLPPSEILKPENVYFAGLIPGPKEPTALQLHYLLMPLTKDLKELLQGYHFSPTSKVLEDPLSVLPSSWPLRSESKIYFRSCRKSNDTNSSDSDSMTSKSSLDQITLREAHSLIRDTAKIINESLPTTSTQKNYFPLPTPHMQHPSSGSAEIPSFDVDYIPSELDISALSDHQIKGEALEHLGQIISDTIIPLPWTRVPHKMGSPSHGSLKPTELVLLYKVYIPFLMLSQQMSLHEHHSPNTQRKMGQEEELANELTKNTFHFISSINIATSWTVSMDDTTSFGDHWKTFHLSTQHLFPKQKSKPNHHFSDHIPELFQHWCPAQASATWGYECFIGVFAKIPTNNKICTSINK
ncbi:hypothetical protein O181_052200 [Austropuccinia psidii MF-1]|uniref:Uncharacterized protein n=1 Tax=Austropuccinia psidii MF-1 TaxID=1389203 RepID=A0A9Q3HSF6_9BASI|nr:hypothetical protein [Austropuccinia psidii MF-1]